MIMSSTRVTDILYFVQILIFRIFCFYFEHIFYRLGVFMPGVLTPIFARREGRGLLATDIITFW